MAECTFSPSGMMFFYLVTRGWNFTSPYSAWVWRMSRLTRDRTANAFRKTKLSGANGDRQGNIHFLCSADHEQDWQPHPRLIHTLLFTQYIMWWPCILFERHSFYSNGTCSTVIIPSRFDQWGTAHKLKVSRRDLENTTNPALKHKLHVFCEPEHPQKHPTLR